MSKYTWAIAYFFQVVLCGYALLEAENSTTLSFQEALEPILKMQNEGKLDGTVLIAKGTQQVVLLDNSNDKLDPCQGLGGQYLLASTGKQMIAIAVLKAIYDNASGTTDEIRLQKTKEAINSALIHFLPATDKVWNGKVPDWANKITIHQMLSHRSGLPEYTSYPAFFEKDIEGKDFSKKHHETWEILKIIEGQPLNFEPGTSEAYNNTSYTLLTEVIQNITKMPAKDYMNKYLFKELGMHDTWAVDQGTESSLRKQKETRCLLKSMKYNPLSKSQEIYTIEDLDDIGKGGGVSIVSTAIDLLKWNLGVHRDHCCIPKELYEQFIYPHSKGPSGYGYGYGIARDKSKFGIALNHSSGSVRNIYVPSEELSLIVLTHVGYDWDRVEPIIQSRIDELVNSSSMNRQEADQQALKEILIQYPVSDRGFEGIVSIFNKYLNISP
ncbi:MAG: serine hydrolase domain-containing protein [Parachlamydiales bacterium]|jgi:CubicO group peptidase (beta-lactamase class C family)